MRILVLGEREVRELLPPDEAVEVMAGALRALAEGSAVLPLRSVLAAPGDRGVLCVMPSFLTHPPSIGLKAFTLFPHAPGSDSPTHPGAVLLFDGESGAALAVLEASSITEIRTAAVSALATRLLARSDAHRLGILGAGTQAAAHLAAIPLVRSISEVRIWDRRPERSAALVQEATARGLGAGAIRAVPTVEDAVREADIICTTTGAPTPILHGASVRPGTHINAVGAAVPGRRELDSVLVARSRLYVDRRTSAEAEADDYRIPLQEGSITSSHIRGELGELLLGRVEGRTQPDEVTLFKSVGIAVEDLAAARYIFTRAVAAGRGTWVDFTADGPSGGSPRA
ncbi:MAG: ornithine cyclodeaminase family protein [Thermoplasmata archaeon]|nr:ornithine cyclodeaminase family protein [Thermoplasmata archaeon]